MASNALYANEYNKKVMLMTALATAQNAETGKSLKCRLILDTACDTTFIKESFARSLGLKRENLGETEVDGFGGHSTRIYSNCLLYTSPSPRD